MRFLILALLLFSSPAQAQNNGPDPFRSTAFPLPRFVSLASDEVSVRTGPGKKYPIQWVYTRKTLPVEIVLEFDHWRKIKDVDGQVGWLHKSLLSGKRTALIKSQIPIILKQKPQTNAKHIAQLDPFVIVKIHECREAQCRIEAKGYKGWTYKQNLWGVYPDEIIKD